MATAFHFLISKRGGAGPALAAAGAGCVGDKRRRNHGQRGIEILSKQTQKQELLTAAAAGAASAMSTSLDSAIVVVAAAGGSCGVGIQMRRDGNRKEVRRVDDGHCLVVGACRALEAMLLLLSMKDLMTLYT